MLLVASSLFRKILGVAAVTLVASVTVARRAVAALVQWYHVANHGAQVTIAGAIATTASTSSSR